MTDPNLAGTEFLPHLRALQALRRHGTIEDAARACELEPADLQSLLAHAEVLYGRSLVKLRPAFDGFTDIGEVVLRCADAVLGDAPHMLGDDHAGTDLDTAETRLQPLLGRRSVSPKRLGPPGPSLDQLDLMLQAALAAPDHGSLHPWRVLEFRDDQRTGLADLFESEKLRRDPLASAIDRRRAREHATRPPTLLAFIVSLRQRSAVPPREQWLAAGAALGNLLNAAHQLGFGAIVLSGERCHDETLVRALGIGPHEVLAGFVSMGRTVEVPPHRRPTLSGSVWSCWTAPAATPGATVELTRRRPPART